MNVKNNKSEKIKVLKRNLFLIILLTIIPVVAIALEPSGNFIPGGTGSNAGSCGGVSLCYDAGSGKSVVGLRVALVDNEGNNLATIVDLWPTYWQGTYGGGAKLLVYSGSGNTVDKKLKNQVTSQKQYTVIGAVSDVMAQWTDGNPKTRGTNIWIMNAWNSGDGVNGVPYSSPKLLQFVSTMGSTYNTSGLYSVINNYFLYLKEESSKIEDSTNLNDPARLTLLNDIKKFFELLSFSDNPFDYVLEDWQNLYIQFEPLILFPIWGNDTYKITDSGYYSGRYYLAYGTASEIAAMNFPKAGYTNDDGFAKAIFRSINLGDGFKIESNKNRPLGYKDGDNATWTFGSGTTIQPRLLWNYANNGNGVAHIWFGDIFKDDNVEIICKPNDERFMTYINNKYYGTAQYDDVVASILDGTFNTKYPNEKIGDIKYVINESDHIFDLLKPEIYKNVELNSSLKAACKNIEIIPDCEADTNVNTCTEDGKTWFKDNQSLRCWLENGISFIEAGTKYSSDNTGHLATTSENGGIVGNNPYCKIYCNETWETIYPISVEMVKAGQTFFWGVNEQLGVFANIQITKTCSTKARTVSGGSSGDGYLYAKWNNEFLANQKKLIQKYLEYESSLDAIDTVDIYYEGTCCTEYTCGDDGESCCEATSYYARNETIFTYDYEATEDARSGNEAWMTDQTGTSGRKYGYSCGDGGSGAISSAKSQLYTRSNSALVIYSNGTVTEDVANTFYATANHNSIGAMQKQGLYIDMIYQCNANIKYIYETILTFVFEEPLNSIYGTNSRALDSIKSINGSWAMDIDPTRESGYTENNFKKELSNCTPKVVHTYSCSGDTCTISTSPTVLDCVQAKWEISGNWNYIYPSSQFTWYSLNINQELLNNVTRNSSQYYSIGDAYFYTIGFGLPTAFSLTNGYYTMKMVTTNLGDNGVITQGTQNYNTENGHFWPLTDLVQDPTLEAGTGYGFDYECTYEIDNEIFGYDCKYDGVTLTGNSPIYCDVKEDDTSNGALKGIDVVYRLVALLDEDSDIRIAFPGKEGGGRAKGSNWAKLSDNEIYEILNTSKVEANNEAMYEIMLDVTAIQYIRKNNEKYQIFGSDPYTSFEDENGDKKIYCASNGINNEKKYCASTFISSLAKGENLNYKLVGTCLEELNTESRAKNVLENGCAGSYNATTYRSSIDWKR